MNNYYQYYRNFPIDESLILYESYRGAGMVCNPYAVFKAFLEDETFHNYKHVWSINDEEELKRLREEYKEYPEVSFFLRSKNGSKSLAFYMAVAKYIVQNNTFPYIFAKRPGQVIINTWHSITVKTLGYDSANKGMDIGNWNLMRSFLQCDYIISANRFMTEIFKNSYKLSGLYRGVFIEEGHPRTDLTLKTERNYILKKLDGRGVSIDPNKKIILYAPTWREKDLNAQSEIVKEYLSIYDKISSKINNDVYQLIIKPHSLIYSQLTDTDKRNCNFIPHTIDANELLSAVDILISDYSSIYFDFIHTERHVLFYIPDFDEYKDSRGLYFKQEELPGPCTSDLDVLCDFIHDADTLKKRYKGNYLHTKEWACKYDDGRVGQRIVDIVFKGKRDYNIVDEKNYYFGKLTLLIYLGKIESHNESEDILQYINGINYDKFDVTVFFLKGSDASILERIHPLARLLGQVEEFALADFNKEGKSVSVEIKKECETMPMSFDTECQRCFGEIRFDNAVDLSKKHTPFSDLIFYIAKNVLDSTTII